MCFLSQEPLLVGHIHGKPCPAFGGGMRCVCVCVPMMVGGGKRMCVCVCVGSIVVCWMRGENDIIGEEQTTTTTTTTTKETTRLGVV